MLPVATFTPLKLFWLIVLMLPVAHVGNGANAHWIRTDAPSNAPTPSFGCCETVEPSRRSFEPVLALMPRPPFRVIDANWMSALAPSKRLTPAPVLPVIRDRRRDQQGRRAVEDAEAVAGIVLDSRVRHQEGAAVAQVDAADAVVPDHRQPDVRRAALEHAEPRVAVRLEDVHGRRQGKVAGTLEQPPPARR